MMIGIGVVVAFILLWRSKQQKYRGYSYMNYQTLKEMDVLIILAYMIWMLYAAYTMGISALYFSMLVISCAAVLFCIMLGVHVYKDSQQDFLKWHHIMTHLTHAMPYANTLFHVIEQLDDSVSNHGLNSFITNHTVDYDGLQKVHDHYLWTTLIQTLAFAQTQGNMALGAILKQYSVDANHYLESVMWYQSSLQKCRKQCLFLSAIGIGVALISKSMMGDVKSNGTTIYWYLIFNLAYIFWLHLGLLDSWSLKEQGD